MRRKYMLLGLSALALLTGCEHGTGLQPAPRPDPETLFGMAGAALIPEERALLIKAAMGGPHESQGREMPRAGHAHPLDGLSDAEVELLFAGTGRSPEHYLPAGHPALRNSGVEADRGR
jgi:hypothetical protein